MTHDELLKATARALTQFLDRERDLLSRDVNERSITHKLAEYLQGQFPEWNVDCEYNRLGYKAKTLPAVNEIRTDDTDGRTIYPDIVVHKRGEPDNLLVIEVKKSGNSRGGDEKKLTALTRDDGGYAYRLGLYLVFDCDKQSLARVTCYANGGKDAALTEVAERAFGLG